MLVIENNKIKLTRGNTMRLTVSLTDSSGEPVVLDQAYLYYSLFNWKLVIL